MIFWSMIAAMAALAAMAVLVPFLRAPPMPTEGTGGGGTAEETNPADVAIYRDQLAEIERDRDRGLIAPREAEAARVEIARRLIKAAEPRAATAPAGRPHPLARRLARRLTVVLALALPFGAWGLYEKYGMPEMPDEPIAQRLAAAETSGDMPAMMRKVELFLEKSPDDARGWQVLAPFYLRSGEPQKAVHALQQIIRINGPSADAETDLAEAWLDSSPDASVPQQASDALAAALKLDPRHPKAHFIHAFLETRLGHIDAARGELQAILADSPPDAPWRASVERALTALNTPAGAPRQASPPDQAPDQAAASSAMVNDMVARLAERLKSNPHDGDGWLRLIRSYSVLHRKDEALAAIASARAAFAGDAGMAKALDEAEKELN